MNNEDSITIEEKFSDVENFQLFIEYSHLREKGLRKLALKKLSDFTEHLKTLSLIEQRQIVIGLLSYKSYSSDLGSSFQRPLYNEIILILERWKNDEPNNVIPLRWLGIQTGNIDLLHETLNLDSKDQYVLYSIANSKLAEVEFGCHHLFEGIFIGNEEECLESLKNARELIDRIDDVNYRKYLEEEYSQAFTLLHDWLEYKKEPKDSFPEWCKSKNRDYYFGATIYYSSTPKKSE